MHEIPYDHDLVMAEIECKIWTLAAEMNLTWDEAIKVWRDMQDIPFSDPIEDEPF